MQNLLMRFSPYIANDNMTPISAPIRDIIAQGDWRSVWDKITSIEDRDAYALVRWASLLMISEFVEIEPSTQLSTQTVSA